MKNADKVKARIKEAAEDLKAKEIVTEMRGKAENKVDALKDRISQVSRNRS